MKYLPLVLLIILFILSGCSSQIVADTTPETVTVTSIVEVENTDRIEKLEADNLKLEAELEKYKELIEGLNELLGNVYIGISSNENWISGDYVAFSMEYNDKFYLISAGHCVHLEFEGKNIKYTDFKFKANFSDNWIYPKLLTYNNNYLANDDYAVFYSDKINMGFNVDTENDLSKYKIIYPDISDKVIIGIYDEGIDGESGSPVIDIDGEITGIATTSSHLYNTKIKTVLKAIDELK
jgi:hypothetical protein